MRNLVDLFAGLADPIRLRILNLLYAAPELTVGDIVAALDLPQAKISRHLAYLRKRHLVATRRTDQWIHYRIGPALADHDVLKSHIGDSIRSSRLGAEDIERLLECVDAGSVVSLKHADNATIARVIEACCTPL
jgi:ArsR family transcriptional regulator